ncbi:hypothetical protein [Campylobacter fetus]|uniref:hypothetical protein n=1 Tax=Campylobacter fetus TaxID=196 RepID=UPI0003C26F65|nr:hypothetical protein [Campylobacter fetus]AGZ80908.1 hypothetical protein CFT03427_0013 [Campylobacter fetus subsp. testudinum 03-427]AJB44665.1 hypothetical protein CR44_00065 [Campylobacter fetus subsp. testudinum]EAI4322373.1 hypothetical protein [Campylobacter fetus]EAI4391185.1 hypothetical protein [Campylobacter fetus]OCS06721.1 hypothetical protein CFTD6659_04575 [Campylobacter fetus subsp. testudinum]
MNLKELELTRKRLKAKLLAVLALAAILGFLAAALLFKFDAVMAIIAAIFITLFIYYHFKFKITKEFEYGLKERVLSQILINMSLKALKDELDENEFLEGKNFPKTDILFNSYKICQAEFDSFDIKFYDVYLKDTNSSNTLFYGLFASSKFKKTLNIDKNSLDTSNLKDIFGPDISYFILDDKILLYINSGGDSLSLNLKTPISDEGVDIFKFKSGINAVLELLKSV